MRSEYAANQELARGKSPSSWMKPAPVRARTKKCWMTRILGVFK